VTGSSTANASGRVGLPRKCLEITAHEPTSGSWLHFCLPMLFAEPPQSDTLVDHTIEMMRPCFVPNCGELPHNVVPVAGILS
jgi:hypothetical protein